MTEKQKKIAALRAQLLAPQKKSDVGGGNKGMFQMNKKEVSMEDKFKRVMDHGTPRLVTKNR